MFWYMVQLCFSRSKAETPAIQRAVTYEFRQLQFSNSLNNKYLISRPDYSNKKIKHFLDTLTRAFLSVYFLKIHLLSIKIKYRGNRNTLELEAKFQTQGLTFNQSNSLPGIHTESLKFRPGQSHIDQGKWRSSTRSSLYFNLQVVVLGVQVDC